MIEENKLRELIKDNKKIYSLILPNECGVPYIKEENALDFATLFVRCINNTNIFETKEEAEWALEFGNITRTETLILPTWEEFIKEKSVCFKTKNIEYRLYIYTINAKTNNCRIMISADEYNYDRFVFEKPLTKENYIDACRLCKQLFLGEYINER